MIRVRPFREADAEDLAAIFFRAVREIGALYYSADQTQAWAPALAEPLTYVRWAETGRTVLVAVDQKDIPLAYGDLDADGHIDHLYCRPDVTRTGVSMAVYDALEALARQSGLRRLYVDASEPARRFFERRGFKMTERKDFPIRGVMIHNFRMDKRLT